MHRVLSSLYITRRGMHSLSQTPKLTVKEKSGLTKDKLATVMLCASKLKYHPPYSVHAKQFEHELQRHWPTFSLDSLWSHQVTAIRNLTPDNFFEEWGKTFERLEQSRIFDRAHDIGVENRNATLHDYSPINDSQKEFFQSMSRLATGDIAYGVYHVYGAPGTGKTKLTLGAANELSEKGWSVYVVSQNHKNHLPSLIQLNHLAKVAIVLDDLSYRSDDSDMRRLFSDLVKKFMTNKQGLLLVTSSYKLSHFLDLKDPIFSPLIVNASNEASIVGYHELTGASQRGKQQTEWAFVSKQDSDKEDPSETGISYDMYTKYLLESPTVSGKNYTERQVVLDVLMGILLLKRHSGYSNYYKKLERQIKAVIPKFSFKTNWTDHLEAIGRLMPKEELHSWDRLLIQKKKQIKFERVHNIPTKYCDRTLDNFVPKTRSQKDMLLRMKTLSTGQYAFAIYNVYGENKVGKFHTAFGAARELYYKGGTVQVITKNAQDWDMLGTLKTDNLKGHVLLFKESDYIFQDPEKATTFFELVRQAYHQHQGILILTGEKDIYDNLSDLIDSGVEKSRLRDMYKGIDRMGTCLVTQEVTSQVEWIAKATPE